MAPLPNLRRVLARQRPYPARRPQSVPVLSSPQLVSVTLAGDSAPLIGDALESVAEWVDRCLVIDTGVTDRSLAIARSVAGAKLVVASFPWVASFAAARNFALDAAAKLPSDWAVMVDTDERIEPGATGIRTVLQQTMADTLLVADESGTYVKERFFRLPLRGEFVGMTHEFFRADGRRELLPNVRFREVPKTPEQRRVKLERDLVILRRYTERYPMDARWFYYLGDTCQNLQRYHEAVIAYKSCATLKGSDEEAAWACYRAAECWLALGERDEAIASCAFGLTRHPGIAELAWLAAYTSFHAQRPPYAVAWAHLAITMGNFRGQGHRVRRTGFRNHTALYEGPYDVLRFALRAMGDDLGADEAERLFHQATAVRTMEAR